MIKYTFFSLALGLMLLTSCQRDDICPESTETTPQVRISFFDFEERDIPKPPANLRVKLSDTDSILLNRVNVADIRIPLRTNRNVTEYDFILNAAVIDTTGEDATGNPDRLLFAYARDEIYINRACSYKVNFIDLNVDLQPEEDASTTWIKEINLVEETIANETNTHIFIYH
ncbi:DUF6452 family protein [Gillisia limnaea]|uniref:Lipoprotein n=1 Tax=Gillisia limnaea (strain DSM 15749 / LMG 21470 / R-8282) TaxID=865937 RepID=H2BV62_GILLR|nr:DUF6452 family protein [Gillisia limnaea]EHQ03952.1 hypothetical protein Gilli_3351 [Gillisia limnaea DSM 15749]